MKIAYLSKEFPPYGQNFASALFYPKLASALVQKGHEVHVISQAVKGEETCEHGGATVHRVGPSPRSGSQWTRVKYDFYAWLKLRQIVRKHQIQLVDSNVTFGEGFFYSLLKETPLVLQTFAFSDMFIDTKSYSGFKEFFGFKVSSFLEDITLRRSDRIVANAPATYDYLVNRKKLSPEKIDLIWEARIDLNLFKLRNSNVKKMLGIQSGSPLILYVGWLQARKGLYVLQKAIPYVLKQFPNALFVLLGRDTNTAPKGTSFKKYILETSRQHGFQENVAIIEDFLSIDELVQLYSACNVFVFPSLSETFGWPTIEAMACGKPVVATRTGIISEIEGLTPGIEVVSPGDIHGLADAIIKVLTCHKDFEKRIAPMNRKIVEERFNFEKMVDQIVSVYEKCVKH